MKLTFSALAIAGALITVAAGCDKKTATDVQGPPPQSVTAAPAAAPTTTAGPTTTADNTSMPNTTVIDGKTVWMKSTPSGLKYYDTKIGTGPSPKIGQTVSVQYTGTLLDGTKFDSSYDHGGTPIDFPIGVGQVIKGWDEGVPTMKVGGKRRLIVPGALAYGANPPTPTIPADATLVFDIELVAVK
jgi:peptidylprolyl isomerase